MQNIFSKIGNFFNLVNNALVTALRFLLTRFGFILMLVFVTVMALVLRYTFVYHQSGDSFWYLVPWTTYIRDHGGLASLNTVPISFYHTSAGMIAYGQQLGNFTIIETVYANYPSFYYFLIAVFSYLPISEIAVIKTISYIFDLGLAAGVLMLINHVTNGHKLKMLISYTLALFLPTLFINSALWAQTDAVYAGFAVWFLYFILKDKQALAMLFIGLALMIKLQIIFIFPLIGLLFLRRKFNIFYLAIPIGVVLLSFVPAYIAGAPFKMPFDLFLNVTKTYNAPNMNSGSLYAFFQGLNNHGLFREEIQIIGIWLAFTVLVVVIFVFDYMKIDLNKQSLVGLATLFAFLTPFLLPHMHDRYFFMGDVFIIAYVLMFKKRYHLVILSQFASLLTYANFVLGGWFFPTLEAKGNLIIAAILNLIIISVIFKDLLSLAKHEKDNELIHSSNE